MDVKENNMIIVQNNESQHYEILQELGDCCTSLGRFDEGRKYYEQAANLGPDEAGPYVGLGVIAMQEKNVEDAENAFRVACRLDNNCIGAYNGLAMVAQERGQLTDAFDLYLKCLGMDSDNMTALLGLFQTSCQMGTFGKVIHFLERYLDSHPGDTTVKFSLAALYMREGKLELSRENLLEVLALDPNYTDAANLLEEVEHHIQQKQNINTEVA